MTPEPTVERSLSARLVGALREVADDVRDRPYSVLDVPEDVIAALHKRGLALVEVGSEPSPEEEGWNVGTGPPL